MNRIKLERIIDHWPVKVISFVAAMFLVFFYKIATLERRIFSVPLNIKISEQNVISNTFPKTVKIEVRGKKDNIFLVLENDISAEVDLSTMGRGSFKLPVNIKKYNTALIVDPLEIKVSPLHIRFNVEKKIKKSVAVEPVFKGYPAQGWDLVRSYISPQTVQLVGPESILKTITEMKTEDIILSGKKTDIYEIVKLKYDHKENIIISGGDLVEFHGIVKEAIIIKNFENISIGVKNLDDEYTAELSFDTGFIKLKGNKLFMNESKIEDFDMFIDCSTIDAPGSYSKNVKLNIPEGFELIEYGPKRTTLRITEER